MSLIVTPAQALARLVDFAADALVDMVLVPPMADLAPQDMPARREFDSTKGWLNAQYLALVAEADRIDAHWRAQAAACNVEVLAESGRHCLHVRSTPAGLAALLQVPDLEEAYFLTEPEGACGAARMPWVYRRSKYDLPSLGGSVDNADDAPLGLLCVEGDLDRLGDYTPAQRVNVLGSLPSDLRWAEAELESPDGHPRRAEYLKRIARAHQRIAQALHDSSTAAPDIDNLADHD